MNKYTIQLEAPNCNNAEELTKALKQAMHTENVLSDDNCLQDAKVTVIVADLITYDKE